MGSQFCPPSVEYSTAAKLSWFCSQRLWNGEVDVGLAAEVEVGGVEELDLAAAVAIAGVGEHHAALGERTDQLAVHDVAGFSVSTRL